MYWFKIDDAKRQERSKTRPDLKSDNETATKRQSVEMPEVFF